MSSESKPSLGLANALSNVFKLAEVKGLKWVRYVGPENTNLEAPKDDPVLNSYAKLLNKGYASSWRRISPSTDGVSGESKDLWVFYFTELPDISDHLAERLREENSGSWEDGMTPESSTMLYRALHNIIERSLLSESFLPLGKWFARPDSSVAMDGSSRGCFLCSFSFFVHAHLYICASVEMKAGPGLQPLLPSHVHQALSSSSGLQVILSPSGLNAMMTGHSYQTSDTGITNILREWELFYPRRFSPEPTPGLPAAIEVVLGGVRLRYPSQFVFVYHGDDSLSTPPPSPLEERSLVELMEGSWSDSNCLDVTQQQRDSILCRCQETIRSHTHRRPSSQLDLPLRDGSRHSARYEPYPSRSKARELSTPGSLSLMNIPQLSAKNKLSRHGLPKYTTPLSSPALAPPPSSSSSSHPSLLHKPQGPPLPTISLDAAPNTTVTAPSNCQRPYDSSHIPHHLTSNSASLQYTSVFPGWWDCLSLPDSLQALNKLQLPRPEKDNLRFPQRFTGRDGLCSPGLPSPSALSALLSPTSKKAGSPVRRRNNSTDPSLPPSLPLRYTPPTLAAGGADDRLGPQRRRPSLTKVSPTLRGKAQGGGRSSDSGIGINANNRIGGTAQVLGYESPTNISGDQTVRTDGYDPLGSAPNYHDFPGHQRFTLGDKKQIDLISDTAVKVSPTDLDQIFDSDDGDDDSQGSETSSHFPFGSALDGGEPGKDKMDTSSVRKLTKLTDPGTLLELSRIYPTPPSVDSIEEKFDDGRLGGEERADPAPCSSPPWETMSTCLDEELVCVPREYAPLPHLPSQNLALPRECVYVKSSQKVHGGSERTGSSISSSRTAGSSNSEPQKFIFPPLASRAHRIEALSLPLASRKQARNSPHIFTPQLLSSSPAFPPRGPTPNPFHPRLLTPSATPLESPYEATVTPTPLSATMNRLMPVLPEAHALYINLALLDSALGANLSEPLSINTGHLMTSLQNLMNFSSRRIKLDSVDSPNALDAPPPSATPNILSSLQEEKPVMTFGIADYPSLGFREMGGGAASTPSSVGSWASPFGALSNVVSWLAEERRREGQQEGVARVKQDSTRGGATPTPEKEAPSMEQFLVHLQDYCLHLCLSASLEEQAAYNGLRERSRHTHLLVRPPNRSEQLGKDGSSSTTYRLYHSQNVVTAIISAKQLVVNAARKTTVPSSATSKPLSVTLTKEDNSASWIMDLLSLPTKFISKRLKDLRHVLQSSFHHAPCLKFTTRGPLTLKDLQQLTPSETPLGDECAPLPMQPVVVGHDHEWLSVSPLALPSWEKLLFEPYSQRKNVLYLVMAPNAPNLVPALKKYFRDLSIMYKNCHLGQHEALNRGLGEDGIILTMDTSDEGTTEDPHTDTRHGLPAGFNLSNICSNMLAPHLKTLPGDEELSSSHFTNTASRSINNCPSPPLFIALYVLCGGGGGEEGRREVFRVLHTFSEMLADEELPDTMKERVVLQLLDGKDVFGHGSGRSNQLRSLVFSMYSRCHPVTDFVDGARTLTMFGPTADKLQQAKLYPSRQLHSPPFILSSVAPLSSMGPLMGTQTHHILFNPEEAVLFCGYCVSSDQRWLLVVCCDRQGELLDTAIIGIQPMEMDNSRSVALQKLWYHLVSLVSGSLFKWNVVITRFGKPSNSEIRDWPKLVDDGLLSANQQLSFNCIACNHTSSRPSLANVMVVSVQPERNIQLFPTHDPSPSISHVMVLPQDPRDAAAAPCMTPSTTDQDMDDFGIGLASGDGAFGFPMDSALLDNLGSDLQNIDFGEADFHSAQLGMGQGAEDSMPKAMGYLISTSPTGELPDEFWGHDRPQTVCSMFKVLLHCHRSVKAIVDPQETLGSTLLCFDALSWLSMDHATRQRRSCLPIHLFILSKMYHLFSSLERTCR